MSKHPFEQFADELEYVAGRYRDEESSNHKLVSSVLSEVSIAARGIYLEHLRWQAEQRKCGFISAAS